MCDTVVYNIQQPYLLIFQSGYQKFILPKGESFSLIELNAAYRYGRFPIEGGLLVALLPGQICDNASIIIFAIGYDRPAVILSFLYEVEFVSA